MTILGKIASAIEPRLDPFGDPTFHSLFRADPFVIYDGGAAGLVSLPHGIPLCKMIRIYGFEPCTGLCSKTRSSTAPAMKNGSLSCSSC